MLLLDMYVYILVGAKGPRVPQDNLTFLNLQGVYRKSQSKMTLQSVNKQNRYEYKYAAYLSKITYFQPPLLHANSILYNLGR